MTSTVGDKVNFALTWTSCRSTRNVSRDFSPKYADKTTTALLLPLHCPERLFMREFRIQPLGLFDANLTWVTVELRVGTDIIVHHRINKTDVSDKNDPKVFFLSNQPIVPATARIWVRLISSNGPNSNDANDYQFTLWGQWIR